MTAFMNLLQHRDRLPSKTFSTSFDILPLCSSNFLLNSEVGFNLLLLADFSKNPGSCGTGFAPTAVLFPELQLATIVIAGSITASSILPWETDSESVLRGSCHTRLSHNAVYFSFV